MTPHSKTAVCPKKRLMVVGSLSNRGRAGKEKRKKKELYEVNFMISKQRFNLILGFFGANESQKI